MSEQAPIKDLDPTLVAPNPTDPETDSKIDAARGFFNQKFGLEIGRDGALSSEPTQEQLDTLRAWRQETFVDGLDMEDLDTFYKKVLLAQALMPQTDSEGNITYLFGKGIGAEISLQGTVEGRTKHVSEVPYRTHSDFELYGFDSEHRPDGYERFKYVFGPQEIYPVSKTKGLNEIPEGLLKDTAEKVELGGLELWVPRLELQFVDKFMRGSQKEAELRGKTDAEFLAETYDLDREVVHAAIDDFVITPEVAKFKPPVEVTEHTAPILDRKLDEAAERVKEDRQFSDQGELSAAIAEDYILLNFCKNIGVENLGELINPVTGTLKADAKEKLAKAEHNRQVRLAENLQANHQAADELLLKAA